MLVHFSLLFHVRKKKKMYFRLLIFPSSVEYDASKQFILKGGLLIKLGMWPKITWVRTGVAFLLIYLFLILFLYLILFFIIYLFIYLFFFFFWWATWDISDMTVINLMCEYMEIKTNYRWKRGERRQYIRWPYCCLMGIIVQIRIIEPCRCHSILCMQPFTRLFEARREVKDTVITRLSRSRHVDCRHLCCL